MYDQVLVFSIKGSLAHFRQPDTTATHATYPFPPRPTIHGLLASVLGINFDEEAGAAFLNEEHFVGLCLLRPVRTVCAQMSMHGKGFTGGGGDSFNRLTTIELVVSPHYLIYYTGSRLGELAERIRAGQSVYHTYLGSAYCLTFPIFHGIYPLMEIAPGEGEYLPFSCVVPQGVIQEILVESGGNYAVARALPYRHAGGRVFEQTMNVIYETNCRSLKVKTQKSPEIDCKILRLPEGKVVCLW
ncbi:CRISPR-associated protein Cas5 [Desulfoscipio geothermicus]|uniref:CRISPR-associated protein Cas5h n=1 Tax=Desulfoscipio geothermicus DSM 3669 TaxID=1121426 RepID=A0A1I6EDM3_9FIRM|nr:CRISPR-associated protein Cas5 [Desulfoscipio geothermicus]SFR15859.1 CRISPR-associated protein Cas5h [Desulfoscipio geothermicus DSM 3669]